MSKIVNSLEAVAMALATLCVIVMMLIVSYDALGRYLFHTPLPWAFELITYYLMILALYLAISATFRNGDHIGIDLFRHSMSPRLRAGLDVLWALMAAACFALIAYGAWEEMADAYRGQEFLPGYITWPAWVSYLPIAAGTGLMTLRLVLHCGKLVVHGRDEDVTEFGESVE